MHEHDHHHKHFYGTTVVGAKGQTVIPAEARQALDIKQGEKLLVFGGPRHALVFMKLEGAEEMFTRLSRQIESFRKKIKSK